MWHIGITGGIGSGKTTVCRLFAVLGIPVYYADERAKALMQADAALVAGIKALLGGAAYGPDGQLDRAYVAGQVFGQPDKLAALNALVHPAVQRDSTAWQQAQQGVPYTLKEAAILFESGGHRHLDKVIVVAAPEALRLARVMARDGSPREAVLARMRQQMDEDERRARADFLIHNDGAQALIPQVWALHQRLLALSGG